VKRSWLVWGGRIAVALGVLYGAVLAWVYYASRDDQRRPVGALVILGAAHYNGRPSPVLRSRLDHALTLYRLGLAPRLLVTGGTHPGDTVSEAAVQRRFLLENNVADSAVVVIDAGSTTEETMSLWPPGFGSTPRATRCW
jgi:vancomycin permeability regulator SanA